MSKKGKLPLWEYTCTITRTYTLISIRAITLRGIITDMIIPSTYQFDLKTKALYPKNPVSIDFRVVRR